MEFAKRSTKLLLADDDPAMLDIIAGFLEGRPFEMIYANHGEKACQLAEEELPDLIIMDWEMPVLNGIEAVRKLARNERTAQIPVIVTTGVMTEIADLETALESGAIDFLRKPLDQREFNARVGSVLRIKSQHETILALLDHEKQRIREDLERKERELSTFTMYEHQKNELLNKMLEQVGRLDRITNHVYATDIKKIERELKNQLNLDKSWSDFKLHFEEVHPDFYDRLRQKYASLSINDCKLCAYLRMGLGNKEIANMTNVARSSIDRALHRLKKKLGLTVDQSLREYLVNIQLQEVISADGVNYT